MSTQSSMIVGVDIGGTFTDVVCVDTANGAIRFTKVMTNYRDIVAGVIEGINKILREIGEAPSAIRRIAHGTTVATNVIVQRRGAKTAILTTQGFEDVLEMGRLNRRNMYDLNIDVQTPVFLAPRRYRIGVPERLGPDGEVLMPLDEAFVARTIRDLKRKHKIEAVAVAYLYSFRDNRHELRTREIIHEIAPDLQVSLSSEVNPIFREYERTMVTAFDAYMRPSVERFMRTLEDKLHGQGLDAEIHVMQSRGGVTSTRIAAQRPVNLFLSGPAGGVVGAAELATASNYSEVVTIDIGGTSCDVALIADGKPTVSTSGEIAGFTVPLSMVGVNTIGAGGGSVLWQDMGGMLRVGPRSAGSDPGPVCYRRGGSEPTITDASLLLGYLNPVGFAGGSLDLDPKAAEGAVDSLASKLKLKPIELALGAHRIMNVHMAEQIRSITIKRGYDPRQFMLMAFGGAGPLHAGALTSMLGMKGCIIPQTPGVLSAYGLLSANVEVEQQTSFLRQTAEVTRENLSRVFNDLKDRCLKVMKQDGMDMTGVQFKLSADMRYLGQSHEIPIALPGEEVTDQTLAAIDRGYRDQYQSLHGFSNKSAVEIVNLRAVAFRKFDQPADARLVAMKESQDAVSRTADLWFLGSKTPLRTPFYRRERIAKDAVIEGPAVIEQTDTTTMVYPQQRATIDVANNVIITGISQAYTL